MDGIVRSVIEKSAPAAPVTRSYRVASAILRVHFASTRLAGLFSNSFAIAASENAENESDTWELYVAAGDDGSPAPELVPVAPTVEMRLGVYSETYALWMGYRGATLYAVDVPRRRALCWIAKATDVPAWERSRPFLPILQVILDATPWMAVHSAAIAWAGRAILLAGPSRAGKTSLALAGFRAGWRFAGDDYVLLRTDATPAVAPIYATARLRDDMVPHFQELEPARRGISEEAGERRHEFSFGSMPEIGIIGGAPLSTILLLDRRGATVPSFTPVSRTAIAAAIVATMAVATPGHEAARAGKLFRLLSTVTARRFDPGSAFGPALEALAREVA